MSATVAPAIPLDISFTVIDIIASDDGDLGVGERYSALCACALTCQDWLEKSRAQLYRSVYLQRQDHFESFSETIASSSYLGSLVKNIRCNLGLLIRIGDVVQAPLPMHIVRRLVSLESLAVVSDSIVPFSLSFVDFLKSFSVCNTLDSLYIRGCHFIAFEHLAGTVLSFPHIKSLQIRQSVWFSRGSINWSAYPGLTSLTDVKPSVEHLSIWEVETPGMHETYRGMQIVFQREGAFDADRLLAREVCHLRSLKSLEFTFAREDIHWVVRTLVNNGSRVLETVTFNYLSIEQTPETVQHQLTKQVIDGILRASPFASVTGVVVKLFANDPSDEGERWSKAVQTALARTHELKMLHFSVHQYVEADWNRDL